MLKFLTHKLRTHSLNDCETKVEERDSGTESDDDAERRTRHEDFCTDVIMKWNDITDISSAASGTESGECACVAARLRSPTPERLYDHHSSEEELEVINLRGGGARRRRGATSPAGAAPHKRRWPAPPSPRGPHEPPEPHEPLEPHSPRPSDDEDDTKVETPVRFRTWPPVEALRPTGAAMTAGAAGSAGAASRATVVPPAPRRRRLPLAPPRRHRPALDFDKMQQLKVGGGVRSWRAAGGAAGELSVFCW